MLTVEERFWAKVDKTDTCWLWTGFVQSNGYGQFRFNGRIEYAHRVAYIMVVGAIPDGLQIDHVKSRGCHHRHCVNPAHLEPVTQKVNMERGAWASREHCPRGHAYDEANTYVRGSGFRQCRVCHREDELLRYHERISA